MGKFHSVVVVACRLFQSSPHGCRQLVSESSVPLHELRRCPPTAAFDDCEGTSCCPRNSRRPRQLERDQEISRWDTAASAWQGVDAVEAPTNRPRGVRPCGSHRVILPESRGSSNRSRRCRRDRHCHCHCRGATPWHRRRLTVGRRLVAHSLPGRNAPAAPQKPRFDMSLRLLFASLGGGRCRPRAFLVGPPGRRPNNGPGEPRCRRIYHLQHVRFPRPRFINRPVPSSTPAGWPATWRQAWDSLGQESSPTTASQPGFTTGSPLLTALLLPRLSGSPRLSGWRAALDCTSWGRPQP